MRVCVPIPEHASRSKGWVSLTTALLLAAACSIAPSCATVKQDSATPDLSANLSPSARTLWSMSRVLASQEKDTEREQILLRLVAEYPTFLPPYIDLAELYVARGQVESAIELLDTGTRYSPADPVLRNNLGVCYLARGRYAEALEQFTAASENAPGDARARSNMALSLGKLGRYDECLALYQQLVPPGDAHWNLAILCQGRGDTERAQREFAAAEKHGVHAGPAAR